MTSRRPREQALTEIQAEVLSLASVALMAILGKPVVALVVSDNLDDVEIVCLPGMERTIMARLAAADWRAASRVAEEWTK